VGVAVRLLVLADESHGLPQALVGGELVVELPQSELYLLLDAEEAVEVGAVL
jgi:hypothetical protein